MENFLRPNSRFLYKNIENYSTSPISHIDESEQIMDILGQLKSNFLAHEYSILIGEDEKIMAGRDMIGPMGSPFALPDGFFCKDIRAYRCQKMEVDCDIIHLPFKNILEIKNMQCENELQRKIWEFWWSPLAHNIPFFLF